MEDTVRSTTQAFTVVEYKEYQNNMYIFFVKSLYWLFKPITQLTGQSRRRLAKHGQVQFCK